MKGRKRHMPVDTLGLLLPNRVEPAETSDRRACALLLGGLLRAFKFTGLSWIVEPSFAWLGEIAG